MGAFSSFKCPQCLYLEAYKSIGQETEREVEAETETESARARAKERERERARERERERRSEGGNDAVLHLDALNTMHSSDCSTNAKPTQPSIVDVACSAKVHNKKQRASTSLSAATVASCVNHAAVLR